MSEEAKLTAKQKKFIQVYAGNATEAARIAGYTGDDNTLGVTAHDLLRNPKIQQAIKARETKTLGPKIATREQRQAFWTKTMLSPKFLMRDRLKASELLGRSQADFIEKIEHSGKVGLYQALPDHELDKRINELLSSSQPTKDES